MAVIQRGDLRFDLGDETVLDGLLRHGVDVPHSCRAGQCRSCLLRSDAPPSAAQVGLKDTLRERGYFLACIARPETDLTILEADAGLTVDAELVQRDALAPGIARLVLRPRAPLEFIPGQFVTVARPDGLTRSYSIASLPRQGWIELHVGLVDQGRMSGWLHHDVAIGESLALRGPFGECFYTRGKPEQPLVLAGVGTGLAPLWGIARDALESGHTGRVTLWQGARRASRLYHRGELAELGGRFDNFRYREAALENDLDDASVATGDVAELLLADLGDAKSTRAFLCGAPAFVHGLRRRLFLAGLPMGEIHADAFTPAPAR